MRIAISRSTGAELAAVVVLDRDLFATSPNVIPGVAVDATVVGGGVAFASGEVAGLG